MGALASGAWDLTGSEGPLRPCAGDFGHSAQRTSETELACLDCQSCNPWLARRCQQRMNRSGAPARASRQWPKRPPAAWLWPGTPCRRKPAWITQSCPGLPPRCFDCLNYAGLPAFNGRLGRGCTNIVRQNTFAPIWTHPSGCCFEVLVSPFGGAPEAGTGTDGLEMKKRNYALAALAAASLLLSGCAAAAGSVSAPSEVPPAPPATSSEAGHTGSHGGGHHGGGSAAPDATADGPSDAALMVCGDQSMDRLTTILDLDSDDGEHR